MRIGFDAKRLFCNPTGLGNYSRTLLRNLGKLYPNSKYFLYTTLDKKLSDADYFKNNPLYNVHLANARIKSYWRSYSIVDQLVKNKIDVFHGLSHEIPFNIQNSKVKSVVTIHDMIFKTHPKTFSLPDRKIFDLKFKNACINADKIIAISESTKNDIIKFYEINPEKIEVIYQSINPIFFNSEIDPASGDIFRQCMIPKEYLLYVGTVEERKNLKLVLLALSNMKKENQIPLVVIGGGKKYKQEAKQLSLELGLEDRVIWIDNLKDNLHLKAIYQKALAFIYPSFYEGFGLPIAEALLCRTPVITSNVSSLPEVAGPGALFIDPNNADELKNAIEKLLEDSNLQKELSWSGREHVLKNFNAPITTEKINECYKSLL